MEQYKNNKEKYTTNKKKVESINNKKYDTTDKNDAPIKNISKPNVSHTENNDGNKPVDIDRLIRLLIELQIGQLSNSIEGTPEPMLGLLERLIPLEISRIQKIQPEKMTKEEKMETFSELLKICNMDPPTRYKMIILDHMINEKIMKQPSVMEFDMNDNIETYVTTYIIPKVRHPSQKINKPNLPVQVLMPKYDPNYKYESKYELNLNLPDDIPDAVTSMIKKSVETVIDEKIDEYVTERSQTKNENRGKTKNKKHIKQHNLGINVDLKGSIINNINITLGRKNNSRVYLLGRDAISHINSFVLSDALKNSTDLTLFYFLCSPPNYPEYYDVFIPEINDNLFFEYTGEKWGIIDRNISIDKIKIGEITATCTNIKNFTSNLSDSEKVKFEEWMDLSDTSNNDCAIKNIFKNNLQPTNNVHE